MDIQKQPIPGVSLWPAILKKIINHTFPRDPGSPCQMMSKGCTNNHLPKSKVFRFHVSPFSVSVS